MTRLVLYGVAAVALSLAATVAVDSFFWGQFPLWPEGQGRHSELSFAVSAVTYYNAICTL